QPQTESLRDRTDREGHGPARITEMALCDFEGHVVPHATCGAELAVRVDYECQESGKPLEVALSCWNGDGLKIFHVDNVMRGRRDLKTATSGSLVCKLTRLPLPHGSYHFNAMLKVNGRVSDHLYVALPFEVMPGDFYRTNQVTGDVGSLVFVEHDWA